MMMSSLCILVDDLKRFALLAPPLVCDNLEIIICEYVERGARIDDLFRNSFGVLSRRRFFSIATIGRGLHTRRRNNRR